MLANQESYDRVDEAIEEIHCSVDIDDDNEQWYDIAAECVTDCFDGLEDNQIEMTCTAWINRIEGEPDENVSKGYFRALVMSLEEYVTVKERLILESNLDSESDEYNEHEAVIIKRAYERCLKKVKEAFPEYLND